MPYYSGGPLRERIDGTFNEHIGGSCLQQLRKIGNILRGDGLNLNYQPASGSVHQIGTVMENGEMLGLDTSNMAMQPVSITRLLESGESQCIEAYPQCDRAKRNMDWRKISDHVIEQIVTLQVVGRPPKIDALLYDLRLQSPTPPDSMFDCLYALQTQAVQLAVPIANGDVATIKMDLRGKESIRRAGDSPTRDKTVEDGILEEIARSCKTDAITLLDYMRSDREHLRALLQDHQRSECTSPLPQNHHHECNA